MSARQTVRRTVRALVSCAVLAFIACSEPVAPVQPDAETQLVRGADGSFAPTPVFADAPDGAPLARPVLRFARWAPALASYDTSFAAVVGTASTHQVMFKGTSIPFLKLELPASAVFFDANGVALPAGTSVAVRTQIDRVNAAVRFGPHGTTFSERSAKVSLNYFALDLGGRRADQLAIWYQPDDMTAWDQQATKLDMELWWLSASIAHFSNYAVSY